MTKFRIDVREEIFPGVLREVLREDNPLKTLVARLREEFPRAKYLLAHTKKGEKINEISVARGARGEAFFQCARCPPT